MRAGTRPKCFHICFTNLQTNLCLYFIVFLQCTLSTASGSYDLSRQSLQSSSLDRIESYEITYPRWLSLDRHKRSSDTGQAPKQLPSEMEVLITAEGQQLKLHLERNEQLLAPGYQEIWYSPSGSRLTSSPNNTGHCYFQGVVRGVEGSSVALSTCSGLRGLISLNTSVSYLIEPLPGAADTQQPHAVFRAENLRLPKGTCLHHHGNRAQEDGLDSFISGMMAPHGRRERRDVSQSMKYVELLLVADRAEFQKHGGDLEKTKMHLLETANHVDKYYRALSIRVAVIGLEIWSDGDKIDVSDNPYSTLGDFLTWRRKQLHTLPNDNAQLITGVSFQGTTIGLAPLKAMCSDYQSGGVNSDHSGTAVGVAATMAHEMGHNFGMSHDSGECCQARPEDGGCIMAAATGHPYPRVFNPCNQRELKRYLTSGGGKCLFNLPNTRAMYGGQRCGNGYLEDGEECDCGDEEECTSPCCNANNCTLKAGAECAHGVCCHDCKLKSPGVLCRAPSGSCDLPEYCDGKAESCPANFYLADGTSCAGGQAYCYTGMCLTLEQQCQSLWGPDARSAPYLCFQEVNKAGDQYGNCGKDQLGKYKRCMGRNATCGKIQCVSSASKPIGTNAVTIDTTVPLGDKRVLCRGTHVYQVGKTDEDQGGDTLDPGLVMAGTKCGDDSVCFGGQCRNASFLRADECHAKCHSRGLCNNNQQCHCDPGWAPPLCDQVGSGGSMDSGPVIKHNSLLPVLLLLPLVVLVLLAAVGLWCCYKHKFRPLKNAGPSPTPVCPVPTEAKPVHANPLSNGNINGHAGIHANCHSSAYASGHANPTFMLTRQDSDRLGQPSPRSSPSCPPRPRHSFTRPTGKPPSIPAYAAQRREGQNPSQTQASAQPQPPPKPQHFATPHSPSPAVKPQQRPAQPPPLPSAPPGAASLGSNSNHSPRAEPKLRPDPPNRPPPPCPIAKPPQDKLPPKSQVRLTIDALQRGKTSLAPSTGHIQQCRPQVKISGKT